jgi:hypothetical protein
MITARELRAAGLLAARCNHCGRPWGRIRSKTSLITIKRRPLSLCAECWEKQQPIVAAMEFFVAAQRNYTRTIRKGGERNGSRQSRFDFV